MKTWSRKVQLGLKTAYVLVTVLATLWVLSAVIEHYQLMLEVSQLQDLSVQDREAAAQVSAAISCLVWIFYIRVSDRLWRKYVYTAVAAYCLAWSDNWSKRTTLGDYFEAVPKLEVGSLLDIVLPTMLIAIILIVGCSYFQLRVLNVVILLIMLNYKYALSLTIGVLMLATALVGLIMLTLWRRYVS